MNKLQWNLNQNLYIFIQENAFENVSCEMASILSLPHYVNSLGLSDAYVCVGKITIIVSDNGLSPERSQAII